MSNTTNDSSNWQAVVDAHPLESHVPEEWLRYGVALLQTMEPGPDLGKQLQQAALAFVQAQKEGASAETVAIAQQDAVLISLQEALKVAGIASERMEALFKSLRIRREEPVLEPAVKATTCSNADISKAIAILVNLYCLHIPADLSLEDEILRAKKQLQRQGIAIASIRLALNHAWLAQEQFSQASVEVLLEKLA